VVSRHRHEAGHRSAVSRCDFLLRGDQQRGCRHRPALPGFIWDAANGFQYFGTTGKAWSPTSINDANVVVGNSAINDGSFSWKAFRWTQADSVQYIKPSPNTVTLAHGINNLGQGVGTKRKLGGSVTRAVLYDADGSVTTLMLSTRRSSVAYALNDLGQVVGGMQAPQAQTHAFVWTLAGGIQDIDGRTGRRNESYAGDINNAGQVVGKMTAVDDNGNYSESALYWDTANGMHDLKNLLDPTDPLSALTQFLPNSGMQINVHGQIALSGEIDGEWRALLLTPVP
jgi:probable HAF family extracellular repeat protein